MVMVLLTTGGTIASRHRGERAVVAVDAGSDVVGAAGLGVPEIRVEEFCRVCSSAMTWRPQPRRPQP